MQKFKPITRFTGFLQGDFEFRNKIFLALRILRFMDVSTDGCTASSDLVGNDRFVIRFQLFNKTYNIHREFHRKFSKLIFLHSDHLRLNDYIIKLAAY